MTDVYVGPGDSAPSDAELILEVRGGDLDAFGALYQRHVLAARKLARQYVHSGADADDVVADAFDRVLRVLQHGGGPDLTFRAYLFTVVRRLAVDLAKGARRTRPTADDGTFEWALASVASTEEPALVDLERSIVARAYQSLPERWQAVLWYTEIEELSPAEIAPMLGLTPNGVSALAYRAREGLRVGYLQEHLTHVPSEGCGSVNPLLGGYVRGGLSKREVGKVESHLDGCGDCRTLVLELGDVAHGMKGVIAPLVLGVAGLAVLGALPVGGIAVGTLAGGGTAGATSAATGAAATGAVTTGGAAGAGGTAAGSAAAGSAVAGSAAGAGSAAAAGTAATTAAVATTTIASGTSVAVAAGAVAVAAVGVVTVLSAIAPYDPMPVAEPTFQLQQPPPPAALPTSAPSIPVTPSADAELPINLLPLFTAPAELNVASGTADALAPRITQAVSAAVTNTGGSTAEDVYVQFTLPEGIRPSLAQSPVGAGAPTGGITAGDLACTPVEAGDDQVQCSIGTLDAGVTREVSFPVEARGGGEYTIGAQVWASGLGSRSLDLPPTIVDYFGAELTAAAGDLVTLENPGDAWVPVRVTNTGDLPTSSGWTVVVSPPAGTSAVGADGELTCAPTDGRDWLCRPIQDAEALEPGAARTAHVRVVADGDTPAGTANVGLLPVLPESGHVVSAQGAIDVRAPWRGAAAGVGTLGAVCRATGGITAADAAVVGTYTNTSQQTVTVRLDAAGGSASQDRVFAPGESAALAVRDGLRVPAGTGTYVLTTNVAGALYSTSIPAGNHGSADCYDPPWDVDASATTTNAGGTVRIEGTITNTTSEAFQVGMVAAGGSAEPVQLAPGATKTLVVDTGRTSIDAGAVEFRLQRSVPDADGDQGEVVAPAVPPTARYATARISPAVGAAETIESTECRFDATLGASVRTFRIPVDNTASTLPVDFTVKLDGETYTDRVPAGQTGALNVPVTWGTGTVDVLADGAQIGSVDVAFETCAEAEWPQAVDVSVAARCVAGEAQLVADVANRGNRAWAGTLVYQGQRSDAVQVGGGSSERLILGLGRMDVESGEADVRLERSFEGRYQGLARSFEFDGTTCVVIDPQARLELGEIAVEDPWWAGPTSWRDVTVVLDNSGSNVAVDFRVVGPNGLDRTESVGAGETVKVHVGAVRGRQGATFTVQAGDWSTELVVNRFTGAPDWCAPPIEWGHDYAVGDVASWRNANYRYVGHDSAPPRSDRHSRHHPGNGHGNGHGNGWWRPQWERVSSCERP